MPASSAEVTPKQQKSQSAEKEKGIEAFSTAPQRSRVGAQQGILVRNARVYTADMDNPWAEAAACIGKFFAFVGSNEEAEAMLSHHSEVEWVVIDGRGRALVPGFNDAHMHMNSITPEVFKALSKAGITSVSDMSADSPEVMMRKLRALEDRGALSVRVNCSIGKLHFRKGEHLEVLHAKGGSSSGDKQPR